MSPVSRRMNQKSSELALCMYHGQCVLLELKTLDLRKARQVSDICRSSILTVREVSLGQVPA